MTHLTTRQAATELNLNVSRVRKLLIDGRIEGAVKHGRDWVIPAPVRVLPPRRTPWRQYSCLR